MNIFDLKTPSFLLDLDILENNLKYYQLLSNKYHKKMVPMTKTHKSTAIAKMQLAYGADGFVVGTIDEALKISEIGAKEITIPYPLIGFENLKHMDKISDQLNLILSVDSIEVMKIYNNYFKNRNKKMDCLLIVNTGLNRFGVSPYKAGEMAKVMMTQFKYLQFKGISTHPGHVYGEINRGGVKEVSYKVNGLMKVAAESLNEQNIHPHMVVTGSTPTFEEDVKMDVYTCIRPGNYVFHDRTQMMLGSAEEIDCSLSVLASVISQPMSNRFIIDCGSKCLGLDKGAHSSSQINDYGYIVGHPELSIKSLSEEVGIVEVTSETKIKIGDKLRIIPNHSCTVANMTNYLVGYRKNMAEQIIEIDIRGNSLAPNLID